MKAILIFNILGILVSIIWFISSPNYEPVISALTLTSTLIGLLIKIKYKNGRTSTQKMTINNKEENTTNSFCDKKIIELKKQWEQINLKINSLEEQKLNETRVEEVLRIESVLKNSEIIQKKIEDKIKKLSE